MTESAWQALSRGLLPDGLLLEIEGFAIAVELATRNEYFLLTPDDSCCLGCIPRSGESCIEVFMAEALCTNLGPLRLKGRLIHLKDDPSGWRYQLREARLLQAQSSTLTTPVLAPQLSRRRFLSWGAGFGMAACADLPEPVRAMELVDPTPRLVTSYPTIDIHSHAGRLIPFRSAEDLSRADARPFEPLEAPMKAGGLSVVCLAVVADTPITQILGGRIQARREPAPGELYRWAQMAYARAHRLVRDQNLTIITDVRGLLAASVEHPSAIIAAEGADFLEGDIDRVDEFYQSMGLRHLQLTHYHVNELGDIQTAPEQHGGLTDFGADVVRRCNRLGVVVDVAHGPIDLVRRAVEVTSKPLVLSHTSLTENPGPRSRLISKEHALLIAQTDGVIGIWPPTSRFADLHALAEGMAAMVDVVGVDHVGLGTDMLGLTTTSALPSYADLPKLAEALSATGFQVDEIGKILGGNYARVFAASLGQTAASGVLEGAKKTLAST